ncbi:ABC transporter ATP-binding protein [Ornithobacterium rhinotracheale]|uniref:ABC-type multidrug transport system, ATPase and permease component n=1 Tax=Ornithobacterium rhinotracheale (strain ATCC 51463 / DSM 15997 / CCUG 23171 / CIP 104009 / LMG 9086) TaxID=867902 RepID=I4A0W9_ORNRL|nr:ABC transporter ATP-binding protein [Ornithobacterium rhinotracheale]AFL97603.1 ABC-type multidrug transport system, ATPase and permease component [Ornithobacterium rhinotracheale DSM 15997]AIP98885.1 antibiotic ABC transporter ATP-binding protein [Ornithobacterium rhinotracheale ORT-UMN 88]KGB66844.1 antibiotic ABC transporter ATP-binding protein [Ornithobacterium rhinotracheale H06-030791]MBN3661846.1 ABC transporter ATP-binding protein [Ornithobacterium rhinotracheale]MCK0194994.1 ABC tr
MKAFKRVLKYIKPYKLDLVLTVFFNILYSLFAIFSISSLFPILKILFDNVEKNTTEIIEPEGVGEFSFQHAQYLLNKYIAEQMNVHGELTVLAFICLITVTLFLLRNIFRYAAQCYVISLKSGISRDIRNDLYAKIVKLPVSFFTDQRKGDLMSRVSSDVDNIQRYNLNPLIEIFRAPFMIIASLVMLIYLNAGLTLVAFIVLPLMGGVISMISKSLKRSSHESQHLLGRLISSVEETIAANKIIKIFNAENILTKRFFKLNSTWRKIYNKVERRYELSSPMSEVLGSVTMIILVFYGGKVIIEGGNLTGEAFLTFIGIFFQMLDPAKSLSKAVTDIARGNASAERVFEILDADVVVEEQANAVEINEFNHEIEFRNVSFSYEKDTPIIKNFNLTIKKGMSVALVGQSGSGKSTIANLLARFYDPQEGEILVDGVSIKDLNLKDFRKLMGMVTQDSILFNDTVYNNIALGKENATPEEVYHAAEVANAKEFIEKLPLKYEENIGEGGSKLSGGQKQRLSIARAVLKNPPIMILDEATSALDTHSERLVQQALDYMMQSTTSLMIAHRLSTIQNADLIVVMENGEIKEQGKHEELIAKTGMYAQLIKMQNFD